MEDGKIVELQRKCSNWVHVVNEIVKMERKTFPKHESLAASFEQELNKKNSGLLYALIDGEVVGYLFYSFPSSLFASMTKLAVKENARRKGHGEALMKAAIEICRARKVHRISLHVDPIRTPAFALYTKLGFKIDTLVEANYSSHRNAYRMFLDLDPI